MLTDPPCPYCGRPLASYDVTTDTWWCGTELKEVRVPKPSEGITERQPSHTIYDMTTLSFAYESELNADVLVISFMETPARRALKWPFKVGERSG